MKTSLMILVLALSVVGCVSSVEEFDPPQEDGVDQGGGGSDQIPPIKLPANKIDGGGIDSGACEAHLVVESYVASASTFHAGDADNEVYRMRLSSPCGHLTVTRFDLHINTLDFASGDPSAYCAAPCASPSDWNFRNLRLMVGDQVIAGPTELKPYAGNDLAHVAFVDAFELGENEVLDVALVLDIASPLITAISGKRFRAGFVGAVVSDPDAWLEHNNKTDPDAYFTVVE